MQNKKNLSPKEFSKITGVKLRKIYVDLRVKVEEYRIIEIADSTPELPEQLGTKEKFWLHIDDVPHLFKIGRPGTGENWAEKVAVELCQLLGLPCASYELATWKGKPGVLSPSIVPPNGRLVHGNELLAEIHTDYPANKFYHNRDHTMGRIRALLMHSTILPPLDWQPPDESIETAFDVFVGYLMLDTWIANQDRHHENWGLITHQDRIFLAPTYDHAASLGQNETDAVREERMTTRDKRRSMSYYIERARSAIYGGKKDRKPLPTMDALLLAAEKRPRAAAVWLNRLRNINQADCQLIFNRFPDGYISSAGVDFALSLLRHNRERLLDSAVIDQ